MKSSTLFNYRRATIVASSLLLFELTPAGAMAGSTYGWFELVVAHTTVQNVGAPNNLGQVPLVNADGSTGIYRFGKFTSLPAPPAGLQLAARGINDAGVIVGSATGSDPHVQAFILAHGKYKFFSYPGWQNTEARGIGPSGLVVGDSFQDTGESAGWQYNPSTGTFTDVTPPGSFYTIVQGINRFGRIAGSGQDDSLGRYGFIWQLSTSGSGAGALVPFLERVRLADGFANARGINDAGVVAGWAQSAGQVVGFVGSVSAGYQLLIPPGGEIAGSSTFCQGINNAGQVACVVGDAAGNSRGFIGSPQGD